jgi:hypothetical protein
LAALKAWFPGNVISASL